MAEVTLYKLDGTKSGTLKLSEELFDVEPNVALVHEAYVAQMENNRTVLAHTKDRSEVSGGGKKPWKQKGTGRARHGSSRSPIWRHGGITFGPTIKRVFGKKINKKSKRLALAMILSDKVKTEAFVAVESLNLPEAKAKLVSDMRKNLPGAESNALVITTKEDSNLVRAAKNVKGTSTISATSLNVKDLLTSKYLIASKAAIEQIQKSYS